MLVGIAVASACAGLAVGVLGKGATSPESLERGESPVAPALPASQLVGQRLIAGFDGLRAPGGLRRMIGRGELAGVILFAGNVGTREETRRLVSSLQRIPRPEALSMPLAVMVDQEGGLVERVPGPPSASAEEMGARGSAFARRQGKATARSLGGLGINVDLAPVLDVGRAGGAIGAEDRSFGSSAARVIGVGVGGFAAGLREGGIAASAKHFPGLGAAAINTDDAAGEIRLSKSRLRRTDEAPFAAFAEAGGELVMLSLATYPAFSDRPAAMSRSIVTGELRGRLGYEGVSITDSLDAAAATSFAGRDRAALAAAGAGSDLLLYGSWRTAREVARPLRGGLLSGKLDREEFEAAVERVIGLRRGLAE